MSPGWTDPPSATGVIVETVGDVLVLRTEADAREPFVALALALPVEAGQTAVVSAPTVTGRTDFFELLPDLLIEHLGGSAGAVRVVATGAYAPSVQAVPAARKLAEWVGQDVLVPVVGLVVAPDGGHLLPADALGSIWVTCSPDGPPRPAAAWPPPAPAQAEPVPPPAPSAPSPPAPAPPAPSAPLAPPPLPASAAVPSAPSTTSSPASGCVELSPAPASPEAPPRPVRREWPDGGPWWLVSRGDGVVAVPRERPPLVWLPPRPAPTAPARSRAATPPPDLPGVRTRAGWSFVDEPISDPPTPALGGFVVEVTVGATGFRVGGRPTPPRAFAKLVAACRPDARQPVVLVPRGATASGSAADLLYGGLADALAVHVYAADGEVQQTSSGLLRTTGVFRRWSPRRGRPGEGRPGEGRPARQIRVVGQVLPPLPGTAGRRIVPGDRLPGAETTRTVPPSAVDPAAGASRTDPSPAVDLAPAGSASRTDPSPAVDEPVTAPGGPGRQPDVQAGVDAAGDPGIEPEPEPEPVDASFAALLDPERWHTRSAVPPITVVPVPPEPAEPAPASADPAAASSAAPPAMSPGAAPAVPAELPTSRAATAPGDGAGPVPLAPPGVTAGPVPGAPAAAAVDRPEPVAPVRISLPGAAASVPGLPEGVVASRAGATTVGVSGSSTAAARPGGSDAADGGADAPANASGGLAGPATTVPRARWLPSADPELTVANRAALRQAVGGRYDAHARVVTRTLAESPGLRAAAGAFADLAAGLVAVRAYCDGGREYVNEMLRGGGDDEAAERVELLARWATYGLRRLPSVFGPVFRPGPADFAHVRAYRPGDVLAEPAFVDVDLAAGPVPPSGVEFAIWSVSAHRLGGLAADTGPGGAVFQPGSRFLVLAVEEQPGEGAPVRVMLQDLGAAYGAEPRRGGRNDSERILAQLRAAPRTGASRTMGFAPGLDDEGRPFQRPAELAGAAAVNKGGSA
ncbi:hypothetical protein [Micromonospora avicenniae]|uniref:hypothetical protein n=1 Tax=Micromonospora avicenniae TaxID=1198245 RepID=UPI00331FD524